VGSILGTHGEDLIGLVLKIFWWVEYRTCTTGSVGMIFIGNHSFVK